MAVVHVPPGEATEVAKALLQAAADLDLPASVVKTSSDGVFGFSFLVPDEVTDHMARARSDAVEAEQSEPEEAPAPKKRGGRPKKAAAESVVEEEE